MQSENIMTRNSIKPIETNYRGYKFRSRLEARWAVFFDHMEIEFYYEPEGYQLPSGWYLPDFLLKNVVLIYPTDDIDDIEYGIGDLWVEIKPCGLTDHEHALLIELSKSTGIESICLVGPPDFKCYKSISHSHREYAFQYNEEIRESGDKLIINNNINSHFWMVRLRGELINESCTEWSNLYRQAVYASRRARF